MTRGVVNTTPRLFSVAPSEVSWREEPLPVLFQRALPVSASLSATADLNRHAALCVFDRGERLYAMAHDRLWERRAAEQGRAAR